MQFKDYSKQVVEKINRQFVQYLVACGMEISSKAKRGLESGRGRASGDLARNISYEVNEMLLRLRVGVELLYGKFVEGILGGRLRPGATKRYFVPYSVAPTLKLWASRHGKEVPEHGGGLLVWGYFRPFMSNAWTNSIGFLKSIKRFLK
jgi:hypothetical protein